MLAFLAALIGATSVLASDEALVLSHASTEKEMFQAIRSIEAWGGKVLLAYPPHVLICQVPRPVKDHIASEELVESVHYGPLDPDVVEGYGKLALWGVEYWNSRFERPKLAPSEELPPLADDVVFERVSFPLRKPVVEREYPEGPEHTSAYMVGSTVVSVILLESNGAIDPSTEDWDEERISEVRKEVGEALEWWARNAPDDADVWFAIDTVMVRETSYEPINHAMRDDEDIRNAILNEVLMRLGYSREKDHYANLVDYANDLRGESYEWAFVIFVVNSFNDSDGSFADLHYAFAYLQGPLVMLTYDNGGWGIENMGGILAHEIGHVFGALDETSFMLRSLPTSGFLQVENGNVSNEVNHMPCIMKYPLESYPKGQICYFTKGQIGWRDKDDDNILDCVDSSFNPGPDLDGNGIIDHWDNLFAVGPRSVKVLVGSSRRFCAIGGRPPYTWSSSDTSVGSISTHGEFKAKGPGTTIVTVTDSEGRMARDPVVVTVVDIANTPPDVPSLVTPLDNSSGQDTSLVLVWAGSDPDGDAITYDVYFGETAQLDSTNLVLRDYFWTDCSVEGLEPGTTYYWKVMASDGQSHISSPIWKFQTRFRYNLHLAGYFIDDATGDKDGRLDSGETVRLAVKLENLGQDVSDLWAVLSSDDPSVDVLSDSSYIEHISSNDIFTLTSPFRVKLKPSASGPITFTLKITSVGQTVSVDSFAIPVNFEPARLEIKTIGPYGGTISDLVIDPFNSDVLYAATPAGVFKTMDGGETWFPIISELAGPQNIAINPLNPNILFAGGNKLHKSVDGGEHWEVLETEFRYISCIAISPFNPSVIYVGAEGGLFRSTDGGETWQSIGNGLDTNIIHKIAFDSAYPEVMYLITITGHLYKSVNGGLDWTLLKETPVSAVAVNPSNNRIIYIGGVNGIMRSCDGGETWENTAPYLYTTSFAFDPEDPMVLYAGTSKGVYKSVDGGENWLPVGGQGLPEPEPQWRSVGYGSSIVLVDPRNPATLYYATQFDGIFKSIDYGHNWQPEDYGITATFVRGFEFDHEDSRVIYAATDVGVYRSEDGGDTWLYMKSLGRRRVRSLAMDSKGNLYVACDDWSFKGGVFAARDGGLHWSMLLDVPSIDITLGESQYTATGVTFPEESFGVSLHLNPKAGGGRCPGAKSKRRLN